ncbi:MAG: hypothetical protein H8D97_00425 [Proteobacteria bacterium]|nr:hypothetical protein [Pseudomonadota bacterium]
MLNKIKNKVLYKLYMDICKYTITFKPDPEDQEDTNIRLFEDILKDKIKRRSPGLI